MTTIEIYSDSDETTMKAIRSFQPDCQFDLHPDSGTLLVTVEKSKADGVLDFIRNTLKLDAE